jgi:nucleoside-diphosphate-sugar epimerase
MFDALGVEFVAADLTKRKGLDSLFQDIDCVIHVAGIHDYSTPDKVIYAVNVGGVKNICDAAEKAGVSRLIHFSSVGVYGYSSNPGNSVKEDDPKITPPLNNYNLSKWEGEQIVHEYIKKGILRATIFRPAAIYGIRSEYGLYNAFDQIYKDRKKKKMLMVGKGDKIEAFLHVEDMCRAVIFACDNDNTIGEIYNISDDTRITSTEFFKLICKELIGEEKPFMNVPLSILGPVARMSQFIAKLLGTKSLLEKATLDYMSCDKIWDNSKLKAAGFTFKYPTFEKGMKETLRWYVDNGWFKA